MMGTRKGSKVCSKRMRKLVYLSLGSNVGARAVNLEMAIARLEELGRVKAVSSFYETEPVEFTAQPMFLNCVVALETERVPKQFMREVLEIEREMGRRRTQDKGPRTIDIDILLFGNATIDTPELTVPHPAMHERRFVLEPLVEIAPDVKHPLLRKTAKDLRNALQPGTQKVKKLAARK
jgi:2-amino-4-hydroxy-6-hydroxymethyldihydropteridine diphosphokinase